MKKNALLTLLLAILANTITFAQTPEAIAQKAAHGLCDCVNETYSNIDNDVKNAMVKIIKYQMAGQEKEMENYANSLSADLATRIDEQAATFQENDEMFQLCVEEVELSMSELALDLESDITEEQFTRMMVKEMSNTTKCSFAHLLMQLGLSEEDNNNKTNNGQINGGGGKNDNRNSKPKPNINNGSGGNDSNGGEEQGSGGN